MKDKETNKVIVLGHRGTGGQQGYIYSVGGYLLLFVLVLIKTR